MDGDRRETAKVTEQEELKPVEGCQCEDCQEIRQAQQKAKLQAPWNGKGEHAEPDTTNPKDLIGARKVPLGLLPAAGKIYGAMAMKTGAEKYGPYNWRDKKVRMTVYLDAIERHLLAIYDGQSVDSESGLPHLGHIIASASILADAVEGGFIIDDRPPKGPAAETIARANKP